MGRRKIYEGYDNCKNVAMRYKTMSNFRNNERGWYELALKNDWLKDFDWISYNRKKNNFWNFENCKEEAKKYKTRGEFQLGSRSAYDASNRHGWLDNFDWFTPSMTGKKWTHETCYAEAKKYDLKIDFYNNSNSAYQTAHRNGWINEYDWLKTTKKLNRNGKEFRLGK